MTLERIKDYVILFLFGVIAVGSWAAYHNHKPVVTNGTIVVKSDTITSTDKNGKTTKIYTPPEAKVTVTPDPKVPGKSIVTVQQYGFCLRPGVSISANGSNGIQAGLDLKLAFAKQYSLGLGSTQYSSYVWASRHINDIKYLSNYSNVEIFLGYQRPYSNNNNSGPIGGLRISF